MHFNPRARVGRDCLKIVGGMGDSKFQSTRPRRARPDNEYWYCYPTQFQSTRPRRARLARLDLEVLVVIFQSTRPRRARHAVISYATDKDDFNPRARVGRDAARRHSNRQAPYFNPRARVGRDERCNAACAHGTISIHAPAWGATLMAFADFMSQSFQSTRPRGARRTSSDQAGYGS